MRNKCIKCGNETVNWTMVCRDCEKREERNIFIGLIIFFVVFVGVIFGLRVLWANYVFNDWRCALSECRIIKE